MSNPISEESVKLTAAGGGQRRIGESTADNVVSLLYGRAESQSRGGEDK